MRLASQQDRPYAMPAWVLVASVAGIVIGLAGLIAAFVTSAIGGWTWLVFDFVYFGGIAMGMLACAAVFRTAQAKWTPAINRLAHSALAFVPVQAIMLAVLLIGVRRWVPWVQHPIRAKAAWLNVPFMVTRDIFVLVVLWILLALLVRWSLVADAKTRRGEQITQREHYRMNCVATAAVLFYTVCASIISFDFIMSLWPTWYSTVFGPYYFCTNFYAGLAVLIIMSAALRRPLRVERYIGPQQFQDLGNLMLGFSLFCMGLFFAQYLTIWYENLPIETDFLVLRYLRGSWSYVGWASFFLGYAIPFVVLQSRYLKRRPKLVVPVAVTALLGVAIERYVLIAPSMEMHQLLISPIGIVSPLAFLGMFVLSAALFLGRYTPVSTADLALNEVGAEEKVAE